MSASYRQAAPHGISASDSDPQGAGFQLCCIAHRRRLRDSPASASWRANRALYLARSAYGFILCSDLRGLGFIGAIIVIALFAIYALARSARGVFRAR